MSAKDLLNSLFEEENLILKKDELQFQYDKLTEECKLRYELNPTVYDNTDVIAYKTTRKKYTYNHLAQNKFLNTLGILPKVATLNKVEDDLSSYELPKTSYIRLYLKKEFKFDKSNVVLNYSDLSVDELINLWKDTGEQLKSIEAELSEKKEEIKLEMEKEKQKKIAFDFGSASLVENKAKHDVDAIYADKGEEYLIENSTVSQDKLSEYIINGLIMREELDRYREVLEEDVSTVTTFTTREIYQKQRDIVAHNRY